jgi:hypothetical protein
LITEQVISHEELLDAVHEASVEYVEAERALKGYRFIVNGLTPENHVTLEELQRNVTVKSRALREAQTQLLLTTPSY